jgi:hypothetical protein
MKKKKILMFFLLLSPIIFLALIFILPFSENEGELVYILGDILTYLLLISPIFVGIGIYMFIKSKDKDKKFINNKVSKKRKLIGKIILFGIISPILIFFIGTILYYSLVESIEDDIRKEYKDRYFKESLESIQYDNVCDCEEDEELLEPQLIGTYELEADEYVWRWDMYNYGYFNLNKIVDIPRYYLPKEIYKVSDSWNLKNNYKLDLECEEVDVGSGDLGDSYKCTVSYNDKVIETDVRHDIYCYWDTNESCTDNIGVVVYSNRYSEGSVEYMFLLTKEGEEYNKLSGYRLENGEATLLPFKYEHKGEQFSDKSYTISEAEFELYGIQMYGMFDYLMDGDIELVTFFQEPTMGYNNNIEGIDFVWDVENDGLYLRKTIMELIPNWGSEEEPT